MERDSWAPVHNPMARAGKGVGVGTAVGAGVGLGVGGGVGVGLGVAVGVAVGVAEGVAVGVAEGVAVGVAEEVAVAPATDDVEGIGVAADEVQPTTATARHAAATTRRQYAVPRY